MSENENDAKTSDVYLDFVLNKISEDLKTKWPTHVNMIWITVLVCYPTYVIAMLLFPFMILGDWQCRLAANMYTWSDAYVFYWLLLYGVVFIFIFTTISVLLLLPIYTTTVDAINIILETTGLLFDLAFHLAGKEPHRYITHRLNVDKLTLNEKPWYSLIVIFAIIVIHFSFHASASALINDFNRKIILVSLTADDDVVKKLKYDFITMKTKKDYNTINRVINEILSKSSSDNSEVSVDHTGTESENH